MVRGTALLLTFTVFISACVGPARSPSGPGRGLPTSTPPAAGTTVPGAGPPGDEAARTPTASRATTTTAPTSTRVAPPTASQAVSPTSGPTATVVAGSRPVYEPTGRCRTDLPPFFIEEKPDGGYYPAADRSGFAALDAHDLSAGQDYDPAVRAALGVVRSLVADYAQTAAVQVGDVLTVRFTGGINGLNGHGTVQFRRFGTTLCQITVFLLDYTGAQDAPLVSALTGRLAPVDPAVLRPPLPMPVPVPPAPAPVIPDVTPTPTGDPVTRALALIEAVPTMRYITDNLRSHAVPVASAYLPAGIYGSYSISTNSIRYARFLANDDVHDLAAVLGHEGQHAVDTLTIGRPSKGESCYQAEYRGFWSEAMLWQAWYGPAGKPDPTNDLEREENIHLADIRENDGRKVRAFIARAYQSQCSLRATLGQSSSPAALWFDTGQRHLYVRRLELA